MGSQEQILDAALEVIGEDGVRGASMRKVAERAEVSLGLLSYHFDDKQALLNEAITLACGRLLDASNEALTAAGDDALERLRSFVRGPFAEEFLEETHLALRISIWATSRTDEDIAAIERILYEEYVVRLIEVLLEARGELDSADARDVAVLISAIQNGLWLDYARHQDDAALERGLRLCERVAAGR